MQRVSLSTPHRSVSSAHRPAPGRRSPTGAAATLARNLRKARSGVRRPAGAVGHRYPSQRAKQRSAIRPAREDSDFHRALAEGDKLQRLAQSSQRQSSTRLHPPAITFKKNFWSLFAIALMWVGNATAARERQSLLVYTGDGTGAQTPVAPWQTTASALPRVRRGAPLDIPSAQLDTDPKLRIRRQGVDSDHLLQKLNEYERTVQDAYLSEQEGPRPSVERGEALWKRLEKIWSAKAVILSSQPVAALADAFNSCFPDAISIRDLVVDKVLHGASTTDDLVTFFQRAYPVSTDVRELVNKALSKVLEDEGARDLTPGTNVTVKVFSHGFQGLEPDYEFRDTLANIAMGVHYKKNWNGHLEILNLPPSVSRLFRKPRYYGGYTFPITGRLHTEVRRLLSALDTEESTDYRKTLWRGKIAGKLGNFASRHPEHPGLRTTLSGHEGIATVGFNYGSGHCTINNVVAVRLSDAEFAIFDLHADLSRIVKVDALPSPDDLAFYRQLVVNNVDLNTKNLLQSDPELDFLFQAQKPKVSHWWRSATFKNAGELFISKDRFTIDEAALRLASAEVEATQKDGDYLFTTEGEVFRHALLAGTRQAINTMGWALFVPTSGWLPISLNLGAAVARLGLTAAEAATADDLTEQRAASEQIENELFDCFVLGVLSARDMASGRAIATGLKSRFRSSIKPAVSVVNKVVKARPAEENPSGVGSENKLKGDEDRPSVDGPVKVQPEHLPDETNWPTHASGDFDLKTDNAAKGTLRIRTTRQTTFLGEERTYHVVQQFSLGETQYQTGFFDMGDFTIHTTTSPGERPAGQPATTLILTAHGKHVFTETGLIEAVSLPPGLQLDFFAPYGFKLADPGLMKTVTGHQRFDTAISLSQALPEGVLAAPNAKAVAVEGGQWWDATGLNHPPLDSSQPISFHDLTLSNYPADTPYKIHDALRFNLEMGSTEHVDIASIDKTTSLGRMLNDARLADKYRTVKVSACRALRGGRFGTRAADIPGDTIDALRRRLGAESSTAGTVQVGIPRDVFEDILRQHDVLVAQGKEQKSPYNSLTEYQVKNSRRPRSIRPETNETFYFFDLSHVTTLRAVDLKSGNTSEPYTGYVLMDRHNNALYVPASVRVVMQLRP